MHNGQQRAQFVDCAVHGAGAELFIVEGESAARSVVSVRSSKFQAVLPLQGKPMNAWRASADKVRTHALYEQWAQAMGLPEATAWESVSDEESGRTPLRFERIVLLMDPDADGIHIGALFVLYLLRWAPALIRTGRVHMARAPMFILTSAAPAIEIQPVLAFHPAQCRQLVGEWTTKHGAPPQTQNVRGLGSLPPALLSELCVDPATRRHSVVTMADAQAVVDVFGAL